MDHINIHECMIKHDLQCCSFCDLTGCINPLYKIIVYLGFNVAFNTVQVISRRVVGRAEETST